ncbi:SMI1/KNR4 family protein [Patescibacteria group bacterium]|nr:SMI1/KNR4 family protein [Patescibacteria group bacterium]MBU4462143.1 SMI1/KNR4 family protein [Patescibacteria group bacterium]
MQTERKISRFERRLNVHFPRSYRQFLLEHGSAIIDGFQILGLAEEESGEKEEEQLDLTKIAESEFCPVCKRQKSKGKITCYNCYNQYSAETNRQMPLSLWVKEKISLRVKQESEQKKKTEEKRVSVTEATQYLREMRPELYKKLVAVCFNGGRVLCLETGKTTEADCPLIDVSLNKDEPLIPVGHTFGEWLRIHQEYEGRFKEAYARVQRRRKEAEERKGKKFGGKKGLLPKPKDWHPIVSKTQDYIVGLTALRFNPMLNCLEVDEFCSIDHPSYKAGGSIRNLVNILFTMARDFTGSLSIAFTEERQDGKPGFSRPATAVPKELIALAGKYDIVFEKAKEGKISHQEGVSLFFAILEMPQKTQEIVANLEEAGYLNKEMITEIIAVGIWSKEEVIWLLENASRPEAIIMGTDLAESRVLCNDSLNYGKSVLMVKRLQQVVLTEITGGFSSEESRTPECRLQPCGEFWILESAKEFNLPWLINKETKVHVEPKEKVLVLSRPRIIAGKEENQKWINENIALLIGKKEELGIEKACLVLNYDFISPDFNQNPEEVLVVAEEVVEDSIYLLFPYDRCDQLDLQVEEKMRRARRMRKFPSREVSLDLQMMLIPAEEWEYSKTFGHLAQNAYDYGELIASKVNISRYRNDFIITSAAVERVAFQIAEGSKKITIPAKSRRLVLSALKRENGISYSFVKPKEMSEFLEKISDKPPSSKIIPFGAVIVSTPYKKFDEPLERLETPRNQVEIPKEVISAINSEVSEKIKEGIFVSRDDNIRSAHQQVQEALKNGLPLAVSYLQPQVFVEAIRGYLYALHFGRKKTLEPAYLRVAYNDGGEGKPFPIFCLDKEPKVGKHFYDFPAQIVSLRHMLGDLATECSIIRNVEIQRKEDSVEQEDFAFRKVYFFIETLLRLIQKEVLIEEVEKTTRIFRLLWEYSHTTDAPIKDWDSRAGLRLHLFQSTGLEPAVVGTYRAVVELLQKHRGKLVVVPRIYRRDDKLMQKFETVSPLNEAERRRIISEMYHSAQEWI